MQCVHAASTVLTLGLGTAPNNNENAKQVLKARLEEDNRMQRPDNASQVLRSRCTCTYE